MATWLLIEDDPGDTRFFIAAMKMSGITHELEIANSAEAALTHLRTAAQKPSMIVMDLGLPDLSGMELLKAIREEKLAPYIPIFVLTSSDKNEDMIACCDLCATGYYIKPQGTGLTLILKDTVKWLEHVRLPRAV